MVQEAVTNTLSLMYSCGMSIYSGQFAFKVRQSGNGSLDIKKIMASLDPTWIFKKVLLSLKSAIKESEIWLSFCHFS